MRKGTIHVNELTRPVLVLAEYFGLEKLIRAVKLLIARSSGLVPSTSSVAAAIQAVDNQSHSGSFQRMDDKDIHDMLQLLKGSPTSTHCPQNVEYATMYLHKPRFGSNSGRVNAGIRTLSHLYNLTSQDKRGDKGGYFQPIFALNWLGRQGFEPAPANFQKYHDKNFTWEEWPETYGRIWEPSDVGLYLEEMLFSRRPSGDPLSEEELNLNRIVVGAQKRGSHRKLKEYVVLQASDLLILEGEIYLWCPSPQIYTIPRLDDTQARSSVELCFGDMGQAMNWMNENGFNKQEVDLGCFLSRAEKKSSSGSQKKVLMPILVYSRALQENAPDTAGTLIPEEIQYKDMVKNLD